VTGHFARSEELFARAQRSIAGGVNSGIRKMELPVPLYFSHGRGARLYDVDGHEHLDFQMGQGALLFGHAPEGLARALSEQAAKGTHYAAQCELEIEVAERLQQMVPAVERVRFNNSATEVVLSAFRLARAFTGRKLIARFEGHYHGWSDEGLVGFCPPRDAWGSDEEPANLHPSRGIIDEVREAFVVTRWNDPEHLRHRVRAHAGQIAAIVFEPCLCNTGCMEPVPGMLETIRELCDAEGALMIADETITGFRFGAAGAAAHYGVTPDLVVFGKAIGGGVPFAALGGRARIFEPIVSGRCIHAGTLNANPLCLAASKWCLDQILSLGERHPAGIIAVGRSFMTGLRRLADQHGIPLRPQGPGLVWHNVLLKPGASEGPIRDYRDYVQRHDAARWAGLRRCLLESGVRIIERGLAFISLVHTAAEIAEALARVDRAFAQHARES
jgi:glutamate-1-semialdehyde 2,1-aminomutase